MVNGNAGEPKVSQHLGKGHRCYWMNRQRQHVMHEEQVWRQRIDALRQLLP